MEDRGCGLSEISASTGQCPAPAQPREPELRPAPGGRYTLTPAQPLRVRMRQPLTTAVSLRLYKCTVCTVDMMYTCTVEVGCHNCGPGQLVSATLSHSHSLASSAILSRSHRRHSR